jgi:hypothetical protein
LPVNPTTARIQGTVRKNNPHGAMLINEAIVTSRRNRKITSINEYPAIDSRMSKNLLILLLIYPVKLGLIVVSPRSHNLRLIRGVQSTHFL